jgi:small multidrug resistance pump
MAWVWLYVAIAFEVIATTALKASQSFTVLVPSLIVVASYSVSFYLMSIPVQTLPLGVVYAVWSGFGMFLVTLIGILYYKDSLDVPALVGMAMIVGGVLIINLLSKSAAQH